MKRKRFCILLLIIAIVISTNTFAKVSYLTRLQKIHKQQQQDVTAENMLLWQRSNGGWPKDTYKNFFDDTKVNTDEKNLSGGKVLIDYGKVQTEDQKKLASDTKVFKDANIDNDHTVKEIRYLLKAYKATKNKRYLKGAEDGINYLLTAQYPNGGWPMFYPDKRQYKGYITYNDNAMMNVMNLMLDITLKEADTEVVAPDFISKAQLAFTKGVVIILKTQLKVNGKLAAWCAQYDDKTLLPAKARSYELPSLSGEESVEIVRLLMRIKHPSVQVKTAIESAIDWFEKTKVVGYRTEKIIDTLQSSGKDVVLVADPASVLWGRFYDLETNKPYFCDRDGIKKNTLAEIGNERRTGYAWYGTWPLKLLSEDCPKWKKTLGKSTY